MDFITVSRDANKIAHAKSQAVAYANAALDRWFSGERRVLYPQFAEQFLFFKDEVSKRIEPILAGPHDHQHVALLAHLLLLLGEEMWKDAALRTLQKGSTKDKIYLLQELSGELFVHQIKDPTAMRKRIGDKLFLAIVVSAHSEDDWLFRAATRLIVKSAFETSEQTVTAAIFASPRQVEAVAMLINDLIERRQLKQATLDLCCSVLDKNRHSLFSDFPCDARQLEQLEWNAVQGIATCAAHSSLEVKRASNIAAIQLFELWKSNGTKKQRDMLPYLAVAIGITAEHDQLHWLWERYPTERNTRSAEGFLIGLVRIAGVDGRRELIEALHDPKKRKYAWLACAQALKETHDDEIIEIIAQASESVSASGLLRRSAMLLPAAEAIRAIGGSSADKAIDRMQASLDDYDYRELTKHRNTGTLYEVAKKAEQLGLIGAKTVNEKVRRWENFCQVTSLAHLFWLDGKSATVSSLDTGELLYQSMLIDFKRASNGIFSPTFPSQSSTEEAGDYKLRFLHGGLLYEAKLRGDIEGANGLTYDAQSFVSVINKALADAGTKERFIGINNRCGDRPFVFADPAVLLPFADKHHVTLLPTDLWMS